MNIRCKKCSIDLDKNNATKNGKVNGVQRYEHICKRCHRREENIKNNRNVSLCSNCEAPGCRPYGKSKPFCSDKCRLMFNINKTDSCWIWTGMLNKAGYGRLSSVSSRYELAHRLSYKLFIGSIPKDLFVCHTCDNPPCVNPDHLWIGTHRNNIVDRMDKERDHSKLKSTDVIEIRRLRKEEGWTMKRIGEKFSISDRHICRIVNRKRWKHI